MKKLITTVIALLLIFIGIFICSVLVITNLHAQTIISELSLQFISGFSLASAVLIIDVYLQEKKEKANRKLKLEGNRATLVNILKNVFKRGESHWNFANPGPTFYFDIGWINPLYDLLTQNNRYWDLHIQDYLNEADDGDKLYKKLYSFINQMEISLIEAEKIDNKLKFSILSPALAASLGSGYPVDREEAQKRAEFEFWIYRATWAGISPTQILFDFALFTKQQLMFERIQSISNEAVATIDKKDYKKLTESLKSSQQKLTSEVEGIRKLSK